ncbi:hypothetical protein ACUXOC_000280 [Corynebacterium mucifaciens]
MAISTQLVASLAAGGGASITAVTTPSLGYRQTYTWGESGKTYLVMAPDGSNIASSGDIRTTTGGVPMHVVSGPIIFSDSSRTFLCIEVATN